jgi:hypothetical protein
MKTGGLRRKPCQKHPLNGYTVIYGLYRIGGKENLMAGGALFGRALRLVSPGRDRTPVLSTFLALPNAIFKALPRNTMVPITQ